MSSMDGHMIGAALTGGLVIFLCQAVLADYNRRVKKSPEVSQLIPHLGSCLCKRVLFRIEAPRLLSADRSSDRNTAKNHYSNDTKAATGPVATGSSAARKATTVRTAMKEITTRTATTETAVSGAARARTMSTGTSDFPELSVPWYCFELLSDESAVSLYTRKHQGDSMLY